MDGVYQCNRNRRNLEIPNKITSRKKTEVDFIVRQKEELLWDGTFEGKQWRFEKVNIGWSGLGPITFPTANVSIQSPIPMWKISKGLHTMVNTSAPLKSSYFVAIPSRSDPSSRKGPLQTRALRVTDHLRQDISMEYAILNSQSQGQILIAGRKFSA